MLSCSSKPDVQYVSVFENTGLAIGVTMPHPHGQIYAFPFIPPLVADGVGFGVGLFCANRAHVCIAGFSQGEIEDGRRAGGIE